MSDAAVAAATPTDFWFIKGGPCIPVCLPKCDNCARNRVEMYNPAPKRIAGEYARNRFSLGNCFNPAQNRAHKDGMACKCAAVNDTIMLLRVPPKHVVHDFHLETFNCQTTFTPTVCMLPNNMAGFEFDVIAHLYDCDGCFLADSGIVPGELAGVDGAAEDCMWAPVDGGFYVPKDQWLEIGISITSLPAGVTMDKISGGFCLTAEVTGFDTPQHLG